MVSRARTWRESDPQVVRLSSRRRAAGVVLRPFRRISAWWTGLQAAERVLYRACLLLGSGCGLVYPPLALIVPGALFALAFFGFRFGRHR